MPVKLAKCFLIVGSVSILTLFSACTIQLLAQPDPSSGNPNGDIKQEGQATSNQGNDKSDDETSSTENNIDQLNNENNHNENNQPQFLDIAIYTLLIISICLSSDMLCILIIYALTI